LQLKEFLLISPSLEAKEVFQAIQTVIAPEAIEKAFPKVRVVLMIEAGTHLITDALMCPYRIGERVRALKLLRSVNESMLLMWDRGLHSYQMVNSTLAQGCQY
jgi:hypothetical protein